MITSISKLLVERDDITKENTVFPGNWLGVLGGGQLAKMFCIAAQKLGYRTMVLDPNPMAPAHAVCNRHVVASFDDVDALDMLRDCKAVTVEFENIPIKSMEYISTFARITPTAYAVGIAQDRIKEKQFLTDIGVSVVPYLKFIDGICYKPGNSSAVCDKEVVATLLPGILKTANLGYDGKGQARVDDLDSLQAIIDNDRLVLEKNIDLSIEFSIILCRDLNGKIVVYPPQQNEHECGVLSLTLVPAPDVPNDLVQLAIKLSKKIAVKLDYVGVLCIEFFVDKNGCLFVNELAPRPHNSGHYTIEACTTNQFEQQVRIMVGLPLGSTSQHSCAGMINLLGDLWINPKNDKDVFMEPNWNAVLSIASSHLHLYGKDRPYFRRKMGHITFIAQELEDVLIGISKIKKALSL